MWYVWLDIQISPTKQLETCCPALDNVHFYQGISSILSLNIGPDLFHFHHTSFALPSISEKSWHFSVTRCVALPMYNLTCITRGTSSMSCLELSYTGRHRHGMGKLAQFLHAEQQLSIYSYSLHDQDDMSRV